MEAFHKIKIKCPYEILEIEEIKIKNKPNEHGYLYLKGIVDDSINFKYAIEASTEDKICIYEQNEDDENNKETIIFNGTIQNIKTNNNIDGIYHIEIEAYTSSFALDIEEKSRSFQDADMSYDDLIKTMLLDYKIYSYVQCMERPMSIGRPFFQYKETDLRFFIRTASYLGLQIYCDIIDPDNVFYFGRPSGREYEIEDDIDYSATLDINKYRESLVQNPESHPTDFFYYEIKTPKAMHIGDKITFKQKKFYVYSYEAEYVRGELIYTYRLCREKGIWQEKLYNDKLIGISLEGKVLEVSGEQVKLHLDIDETQNQAKAAWFRYAPPTGNIMYSMPIVGTSANLYFPNERNEEPIVIGCVRKNGNSCEKFSNVNNRYFSTESGNNLDMLPDAINFSRPGLSANFNDGSGITLSSSSSLSINAGYVGMFAGNVSIKGTRKLVAEKGASIISLENDFYNSAGIVKENGSDRASNEPFDDDPQKGAAEAKAAIEAAAQFAVGAIAAAVEGAFGKIGECIFNGTENNSENVKDVRLGASPNTSKSSNDSELQIYNINEQYNEGDRVKVKLNGQEFPATMTRKKDGSLYAKVDDYSGLVNAGIESGEKSKTSLKDSSLALGEVVVNDLWLNFWEIPADIEMATVGGDHARLQIEQNNEKKKSVHEQLKSWSDNPDYYEQQLQIYRIGELVSAVSGGVSLGIDIAKNSKNIVNAVKELKSCYKASGKTTENLDNLQEYLKRIYNESSDGDIDDLLDVLQGRKIRKGTDEERELINTIRDRYRVGKRKNVAVANGIINGENINLECASGKFTDANYKQKGNFKPPNPDDYHYTGIYDYENHTEQKIVEYLYSKYSCIEDKSSVYGKIEIISERDFCPNCCNIVDQFEKDFPNIEVIRVEFDK